MKINLSIRNIAWFSLAPLISAIISFITVPLTTWLIVPEEFAKSSMFTVIQMLIIAVLYLGMDHAFVREFNETGEKKKLLYRCLILPLLLSLIIVLFLIILLLQGLFITSISPVIVILLAIWIPFSVIERFVLLYLRMNGQAKEFALFNIFIKVSILIFTMFFLAINQNYIMVIMGLVVGQVVVDIILLCKFMVELKKEKILSSYSSYSETNTIKSMLKYGLPLMVGALAMWSLNSTDRLFLESYVSYESLGIYFSAVKIVAILLIFHNVFATVWVPTAFRWYKNGVVNEQFHIVNKSLFFIMSLVFIVILLFKNLLINILSSEYRDAVDLVPFLLFVPIMYSLSETTGLGISFSRKSNYNLYISLFVVAANLFLNFLLISNYGIIGASVATATTYIIYFWTKTMISRRLWFKFDIKYFGGQSILLISCSIGNLLLKSKEEYIFNILVLVLFCWVNKSVLLSIKSLAFSLRNV